MMSKSAKSCETCGRKDEDCSNCEGCLEYSMWIPKTPTMFCDSKSTHQFIDLRGAESNGDIWKESTPEPMVTDTAKDSKARYYDAGGLETLDIIKAKLTPDQYKGWLLGNLIKYSCRANFKNQMPRDIEKVAFYSAEMFKLLEV